MNDAWDADKADDPQFKLRQPTGHGGEAGEIAPRIVESGAGRAAHSQKLSATAGRNADQAGKASHPAEEVSNNVLYLARAVEERSAVIREIFAAAGELSTVTAGAVFVSQNAGDVIQN